MFTRLREPVCRSINHRNRVFMSSSSTLKNLRSLCVSCKFALPRYFILATLFCVIVLILTPLPQSPMKKKDNVFDLYHLAVSFEKVDCFIFILLMLARKWFFLKSYHHSNTFVSKSDYPFFIG